jgi:hypothetical protein
VPNKAKKALAVAAIAEAPRLLRASQAAKQSA